MMACESEKSGFTLPLASVEFFLDLPFDREPVTVPAGNVVGFPARHLMRTDDDVLQRLVERRADVNVAVGVRRPVVEDEFRAAFAAPAQLRIQILTRPARQNFWLLLRQTSAHGKIRLRQIEGARVIEVGDGRVGHECEAKFGFGCKILLGMQQRRGIRGFGAIPQIQILAPARPFRRGRIRAAPVGTAMPLRAA